MTEQAFSLVPFPAPAVPEISIAGTIARQNHLVALHYFVAGTISEIVLPSQAEFRSRKHELWKETCFEFFLAIADQPQYWEFNMSPSGDWNVYRMDAYRRIGFREETSVPQLKFDVQRSSDLFTLRVAADLSSIFQPSDFLEAGITAIIHTKDGNETYWALVHPGLQADFHLRQSFIPVPAGQTQPLGQCAPGG